MQKNCSIKYSLMIIIGLILASFANFSFKKRTLAMLNYEVLKIELRPLVINKNCFFQTKDGFSFILKNCERLKISEKYTIIGRARTLIDSKINWQNNFDVKDFYLNYDQSLSVFNLGWRLFAYYERKVALLQTNFLNFLQANFSREKYQLITALILGTKVFDFDQELKLQFSQIGLSHMIAVSGFHLGVVAGVFDQLLQRFLSRKRRKWLILPGLWFYVSLVGSSLSVVRGCLMLSISFIGRNFFYKQTNSLLVLFLAFILMFNCSILNIFDAGFLLSYLATLGILLFAGELGSYFTGENTVKLNFSSQKAPLFSLKKAFFSLLKYVKEMIIVSISAQLLTLPVTWFVFREYAWWSILSTILFSFLIVFIVIICVYLLLTFTFAHYFPIIQTLIVGPLTFYLNLIINFFWFIFVFYTSFFNQTQKIDYFPEKFVVIGYYVFWILFAFFIKKQKRKRNVYLEKI